MKKTLTSVLALAMAATLAQAANRRATVDGNWTNAAIWNVAPTAADNAQIRAAVTVDSIVDITKILVGKNGGPGTLTALAGSVVNASDNITVGEENAGALVLEGGTVDVIGAVNIGNNASTTGSLTIESGLLKFTSVLSIGNVSSGSMTMNGGSIIGNRLTYGTADGLSDGAINLLGGTMTLTNITSGVLNARSAGSLLTIGNDASMALGGDQLLNGHLNSLVASNNLAWANGTSSLGSTYGTGDKTWDDGSGSYLHAAIDGGETIVWVDTVIPEPATLGLVGIGVGLLYIRRRFPRQ